MKPFSYEWWYAVGKRAYNRAEDYAWQSHYWGIASYCMDRGNEAYEAYLDSIQIHPTYE